MHAVLAYVEGFSLIAAGLGAASEHPGDLVRRLVDASVRGSIHWQPFRGPFPAHLCKAARLELAGRLVVHARMRGAGYQTARLSPVQIGDLRGVEDLAHWAGEVMPCLRASDNALINEAVNLAGFVRRRLEPFVGEPDDEDTVRLTPPPSPGDEPAQAEDNH